jgi:3-phenylpropionate/cinnamic acid dioxygenase small subunit
MPSDVADRLRIHELINLHGHLMDDGAFDRLPEFVTADVVYDISALGGGTLNGMQAIADAGRTLGERNPLGHHVTNIVVTEIAGDRATARSKGLGVMSDGRTESAVYDDELRRTQDGWRLTVRRIRPRRKPLHP